MEDRGETLQWSSCCESICLVIEWNWCGMFAAADRTWWSGSPYWCVCVCCYQVQSSLRYMLFLPVPTPFFKVLTWSVGCDVFLQSAWFIGCGTPTTRAAGQDAFVRFSFHVWTLWDSPSALTEGRIFPQSPVAAWLNENMWTHQY